MMLEHFQLAPSQLMLNSWRYLLGLVVLSLQYDIRIDLLVFLNFFYLKSCKEGRFTFYAWNKMRILKDLASGDTGWKNKFFFVKKEGLFGPESGVLSALSIPDNLYVYPKFSCWLWGFLTSPLYNSKYQQQAATVPQTAPSLRLAEVHQGDQLNATSGPRNIPKIWLLVEPR